MVVFGGLGDFSGYLEYVEARRDGGRCERMPSSCLFSLLVFGVYYRFIFPLMVIFCGLGDFSGCFEYLEAGRDGGRV